MLFMKDVPLPCLITGRYRNLCWEWNDLAEVEPANEEHSAVLQSVSQKIWVQMQETMTQILKGNFGDVAIVVNMPWKSMTINRRSGTAVFPST